MGNAEDSRQSHFILAPIWQGCGRPWEEELLSAFWQGNSVFWGLPLTKPLNLQVGEGTETESFRTGAEWGNSA